MRDLAAAVGRAEGHLTRVLDGEREPSDALLAALRRELAEGWAFAVGEANVLAMPIGDRGQE
jgi:hypothetical protein